MIKKLCTALAVSSLALVSIPAAAQSAAAPAEETRTTYRINYIKLKPGADDRWSEIRTKYAEPAAAAAKLPPAIVHWMMDGPWDLMILVPMPRGMASMDKHMSAERVAYRDAFIKVAGGEEAARKIWAEADGLIANSSTAFSHTHP
jgi:hypothetical protein